MSSKLYSVQCYLSDQFTLSPEKLDTSIFNTRSDDAEHSKATILVLSDAGRKIDHVQITILVGLLFGNAEKNFLVHTLSWTLHKSAHRGRPLVPLEYYVLARQLTTRKVYVSTSVQFFRSSLNSSFLSTHVIYSTIFQLVKAPLITPIMLMSSFIFYESQSRNVFCLIWVPENSYFQALDPCQEYHLFLLLSRRFLFVCFARLSFISHLQKVHHQIARDNLMAYV